MAFIFANSYGFMAFIFSKVPLLVYLIKLSQLNIKSKKVLKYQPWEKTLSCTKNPR